MAKAQFFSWDMLIASLLLVTIILSAAWVWDYSKGKTEQSETRNSLEMVSANALSSLVMTPGNPQNWSDLGADAFIGQNVRSLGISNANDAWVLNATKIQKLVEMDSIKYNMYKELLGIRGVSYEFELKVSVWNGAAYADTYAVGIAPYTNASNVVKRESFALLNSSWARVAMEVWQQCLSEPC